MGRKTKRRIMPRENRRKQNRKEAKITKPQPQVTKPGPQVTKEPKVTKPEVTKPGVTKPGVTKPEVMEPQVTEPQVTEPQVTEPEPKVTKPEVMEPQVTEPEDIELLEALVRRHFDVTGSRRARALLDEWRLALPKFWKVAPRVSHTEEGAQTVVRRHLTTLARFKPVAATR